MFERSQKVKLLNRHINLTISSVALLMVSACGGGNSSSSSPPAASVNQAPLASASSKLSIVTEGQAFELDGSGSTDRDGDNLTYSWRQISGPSIEMGATTNAQLSLVAPLLDNDEDVSFELSVSDGTISDTSTVTLKLEDLKVSEVLSSSSEYGTGGPPNPVETIPDPSIYEGGKPLDRIIGLTSESGGGYRVHWTSSTLGHDMPVSSQAFTVDGAKSGVQTDGVFLGGERGTFEYNGQTYNNFSIGITFATVQSGDTLFNFNGKLAWQEVLKIGYDSYRGLVEGEIEGFGDELIAEKDYSDRGMGGAYTAVGQDKVLLILSERTTEEFDDPDAKVTMTSIVVDKFGQTEEHNLDEYAFNGTIQGRNKMTVTPFNGDSYLAVWSQNTENSGYDIRMQRATQDGVLLGAQETVNTEIDGDQLTPLSTTLTDGNMIIAWLNHTETEDEGRQIRARVMQPNGTFITDAITLAPSLPENYSETSVNQPFYMLTPLNTNEVLLTWEQETFGEDGEPARPEILALVFDAELNVVSNEFVIATGDEADGIRAIQATTLPDNRVIIGWHNDYPYNDEREDTSHTVGFYPVGKE